MTMWQLRTLAVCGIGFISIMASCSGRGDLVTPGRQGGGSRMSSVTMSIPDKIKPYMGDGKINAWSLSLIGGECANGGSSLSTRDKFGIFADGPALISEKISTGCAYTIILSLGKANTDKSGLDSIYLTNDLDGKRTELSQDKTRDTKIAANITLYFTAEGERVLGRPSDSGSISGGDSAVGDGQDSEAIDPPSTSTPSEIKDCYKGDQRTCKIEFLIAQKTNAYRRQSGLSDLQFDPKVSFVARNWSTRQSAGGFIGHSGFPEARVGLYQREFGTGIFFSAENVAMNFCNGSEEAVAASFAQQWWDSPGHRANMLGGHAAIGVGIVETTGGACYGTQIFR